MELIKKGDFVRVRADSFDRETENLRKEFGERIEDLRAALVNCEKCKVVEATRMQMRLEHVYWWWDAEDLILVEKADRGLTDPMKWAKLVYEHFHNRGEFDTLLFEERRQWAQLAATLRSKLAAAEESSHPRKVSCRSELVMPAAVVHYNGLVADKRGLECELGRLAKELPVMRRAEVMTRDAEGSGVVSSRLRPAAYGLTQRGVLYLTNGEGFIVSSVSFENGTAIETRYRRWRPKHV